MFIPWEKLSSKIQNQATKPYYEHLKKKRFSLFLKRITDIILSIVLLIVLFPIMLLLMIIIPLESKGSPFFLQERVTQNNKTFKIIKFRTMKIGDNKTNLSVTVADDQRITKIGEIIRRTRLDEVPQVINVLLGDMTFVGTRPEVFQFVKEYTPEMYATLLLPAGITSKTSLLFRNEQELLSETSDPEKKYIEYILPQKMKINLEYLETFSISNDMRVIIQTIKFIFGRK